METQRKGRDTMPDFRGLALVAAAVSATIITTMSSALADPGETTHVDQVTATVGATAVEVAGTASFVDVPVQLGPGNPDQPTDEALEPIPQGNRAMKQLTISRPDPFGPTLKFTAELVKSAELPAGMFTAPEVITYRWRFIVSESGGPPIRFQLIARQSDLLYSTLIEGAPSAEPKFFLQRCDGDSAWEVESPTGTPPTDGCPASSVFDEVTPIEGEMSDNAVEWDVPLSAIGAQAGSRIDPDGTYAVSPVLSAGSITLPLGAGIAYIPTRPYRVPGPSIRLGIAPIGVPMQDVTLTEDGTVQPDGAIGGRLPTPVEPGEYVVVVQACNGPSNCGLASTTITI